MRTITIETEGGITVMAKQAILRGVKIVKSVFIDLMHSEIALFFGPPINMIEGKKFLGLLSTAITFSAVSLDHFISLVVTKAFASRPAEGLITLLVSVVVITFLGIVLFCLIRAPKRRIIAPSSTLVLSAIFAEPLGPYFSVTKNTSSHSCILSQLEQRVKMQMEVG